MTNGGPAPVSHSLHVTISFLKLLEIHASVLKAASECDRVSALQVT